MYLAIIILSFFNISSQAKPEFVEIRHGESTWIYNLDNNLVIQPVKDKGTCLLLIENKTVRVTSSDCPLNICIQTGVIKEENQWIACLPHKIFISITGSGEITNKEDNFIDT
ncbi:MAG: NusG domain II-containing protein, partial [Spirochaetia bacterium]|nr:NusG domain II-containing protein [Spirochaetia bacterium]